MEMIDLYINEVTQRLPQKMRDDIGKELRSLIEDALEDESQAQGRLVDSEMVATVLKRMGAPAQVAASYLPPRYLIGPQLFPHYINTLRIVVSVAAVITAIGLTVSLAWAPAGAQSLPDLLADFLGGLVNTLLQAAAIVTLVFAILQFTSADLKGFGQNKEWDPRQMKPQSDDDRIKVGELIAEVIFSILALLVFNVYPQWIGLFTLVDGQWVHAPLLTEAFFHYLPFLSAIWAIEIGRDMALLGQGRWSTSMRWFSLALGTATIVLFGLMLSGPSIVTLDLDAIGRLGWGIPDPEQLRVVVPVVEASIRMVLGFIILGEVIDMVKHLYRLVLKDRLPALQS